MPLWAQDVIVVLLFGGVMPAYAVFLYRAVLACAVKGCWRMQTIAFVSGLGFVCAEHKD
jgi:hypothetical protein